jgi:hypothetical protein
MEVPDSPPEPRPQPVVSIPQACGNVIERNSLIPVCESSGTQVESPPWFSNEQLRLIFELHSNMAEHQYRQEMMDRKLASLLESLSGQQTSQHCPVCSHSCVCALVEPVPPCDVGNNSQFGV